jgi:AraC-like DNA-binding protein
MELPWGHTIRARGYTFYRRREEFVSTGKIFVGWACVAPESGRFRFEVEGGEGVQKFVESGEAGLGEMVFAAPERRFDRFVISPLTYHVLQWDWVDGSGRVVEGAWRAGKWSVGDTSRLRAAFAALRPLLGRADAWATRRREHLLEEVLHLAWQEKHETALEVLETSDPLMQQAALLMREGARRALAMSEVSRAVGLGPVQFTRRFRAAFGHNPIEFLTQVRIENAQRMLIETDEPLDEIARRCGWSSGAYLSSVFEKNLGTTPGRFRKAHRV